MHTGMLWFDNSTRTLVEKIQAAMNYYQKKYGRQPNLCLVNPGMLGPAPIDAPIAVHGYRPVLPGHIWIGIEDVSQAVDNGAESE